MNIKAIVIASAAACSMGVQAMDFFEPSNSTLQLDYVNLVGSGSYSTVVARITGYELLGVDGGTAKADTFDPATGILSLGAVSLNRVTYNNVRARLTGYQLLNIPAKLLASDAGSPPLMNMPASGYSQGTLEQAAIDGINAFRINGGFGAASFQKQLDSAAKAHLAYLQSAEVTTQGTAETEGKPNYLAATPTARCAYYGFSGTCIEVATASSSSTAIHTYDLAAPWTRVASDLQTVLDYRNTLVGAQGRQGMTFWSLSNGQDPYMYKGVWTAARTNVQLPTDKASGIVGVYPYHGLSQVGVGISDGKGGTGVYVLAQFPDDTNPTISNFVIRKDGTPSDHPSVIIPAGTPTPNGASTQQGWAILEATAPLDPNAVYTATLTGSWKGKEFSRSWGFKTGSSAVTPVRR